MHTSHTSELAIRVVDAVTPSLDPDEHIVLRIGLGTDTSRQVIAVALDLAAQKQWPLPDELIEGLAIEGLASWQRPQQHCRRPVGARPAGRTRSQARTARSLFHNTTTARQGITGSWPKTTGNARRR